MNATFRKSRMLAAGVFMLCVITRVFASPPQVLSTRATSAALPAGGNGNSVSPLTTPDGRFVLFASSASDLVAGDNGQLFVDVFLRDRGSNTTTLVSVNFAGPGGGNGNSRPLGISTNGRYALFESEATGLLPGDTNGLSDLFVRDLLLGTNLLVNASTNGGWANGESSDAVMTPDGRYVAFVSAATNLVAGDTNSMRDVFVRDLVAGATVRASVGAISTAPATHIGGGAPVITPDGSRVVFTSTATGLVAGATNTVGEIYVRNLVAGTTTWASTNAAALALASINLSNVPSYHPSISDDGRFVAFKTGSSNGVNAAVVLRHDLLNGQTILVATNAFPAWAYSDDIFGPEMTPDGNRIVYVARQLNGQSYASVQVWDAASGTNQLVSVAADGSFPSNTVSHSPAITPAGRQVTFLSNAGNLTTNSISNGFHIFERDLVAGTTQLVDADTNGVASSDAAGAFPRPSDDGRFVAFCSPDGRLVTRDSNLAFDVFVRDTFSATTDLISVRDAALLPLTSRGVSSMEQFAFSSDGRWLIFASLGDDLVLSDTNQAHDIFICDIAAGTNLLVSVGTNGVPALGGSSTSPALSANGRFAVFVSAATNLVAGQSNPFFRRNQIYLHDLQARTNLMISVAADGLTPGTADSESPVISQDGRYVVFVSKSGNLVPVQPSGNAHTFRRDMANGQTITLASASTSTLPPSMSSDGRYVAYSADARVRVWDGQLAADIFTNAGTVVSFALSPTGAKLAYQVGATIFVADVSSGSNFFSYASSIPIQSAAQWSADGRFFAFVTGTSLVAGDNNNTNDVYLRDTAGNTLSLVSIKQDHIGSASGPSDAPVVSWDGRFVVFRSFATNVTSGSSSTPNIFVYDRFTGSNSVLTINGAGSPWSSWVARPNISSDARNVAFLGWAALTEGDLNRVQDVFATTSLPPADSDGDGMDDAWELHYFSSRVRDGSSDFDHDGASDLAEFLAGTDPTSPASYLRLEISSVISGGSVTLSWPAVPGKTYRVQAKGNLIDLNWVEVSDVLATLTHGSFTVSANQPSRYYRIMQVN